MSIKTLILIAVLVLLSMLNNWWKRRQEGRQEEPSDWPDQSRKTQPRPPSARPPGPSPQRQPASWEEELRRLLQGESPAAPAPPVRPPPPLPVPPPIPPTQAPRPVGSVRVAPRARAGGDPDMERGLPVQMPTLGQSARAYLRASQLGSNVADQMRRVEERVAAHKQVQASRETSAAVRQAIGLVRHRSSQQTAILAGVILGPPRSLEM